MSSTKKSDTRRPSLGRRPLAIYRGVGIAVSKDFARSRSARKYRQRLANGEYADLLAELEQVERDLQSRPVGWSDELSTRQRSGVALWKRLCLVWDFSPREPYAAQFLNSTRRRLATRDEETRLLASSDPKRP